MSCRLVRRHIGAYVDGELDPTTQIEFERHVSACAGCQEMLSFEQSFRGYLREAAGGESAKAPAHLTGRVREALQQADAEDAQRQQQDHRRGGVRFLPVRARYAVPAAAAAVLLLFVGISPFDDDGRKGAVTQAGATPSLKDVVRLHSSELPADVRGEQPEQVVDYFRRKAGVAVQPVRFGRKDVRLTGARLHSVRDGRAPAFYYDVHGRRVTVVALDNEPTRPLGDRGMKIRLGGRELFYQQVGGYVVPVRRHAGRSYAFTGDLDRETMLQLAASSRLGR